MALTLTASYVSTNETAYASKHGYMLKALDELLYSRYNGKSPLVYQNLNPSFPLGDCFSFGTPQNLRTIASSYQSSKELPSGGATVVTTYPDSQVALVTGGDGYRSLNRKQITYSTQSWWMDESGNNPERFERLSVADIAVENYSDPIAGNTSTFHFRNHWTKFGCVRIHNGNRFTLTVYFDGLNQTSSIAPYGILSGRRLHQTGSFTFDANYLHITKPSDRMTYQRDELGQSAACMDTAYEILSTNDWVRYNQADIDYDTTNRETASYTNSNPVGTDYFYDWIVSRGNLLSVLIDYASGSVINVPISYTGIGTGMANASYASINYINSDSTINIRSTVSYPHPNYGHYLIPTSTNITLDPIDIKGSGTDILLPAVQQWNHLQNPLTYGTIVKSSVTTYAPAANGDTYTYNAYSHTQELIDANDYNQWHKTLNTVFTSNSTTAEEITIKSSSFFKSNGSIGKRLLVSLPSQSLNYADYSTELLQYAKVTDKDLEWILASSFGKYTSRQRFVPFAYRKYQEAGSIVGGVATYTSHPEDNDMEGTTDKSGSQRTLSVFSPTISQLKIEGADFIKTNTDGMAVYAPVNNTLALIAKANTNPQWFVNNDPLIISENQKLLTWRLPRLIEHLNDLVKAINNVAEVYPLDVRHLYYKPLPSNCFELPFTFNGDDAWSMPTDWVAGRTEGGSGGTALANWASYWGVTTSDISATVDALMAEYRYSWYYMKSNRTSGYPYGRYTNYVARKKLVDPDVSPIIEFQPPYTVNGVNFFNKLAMTPDDFRKLFGGISPYSSYKYIKKNDMLTVFTSLGINIPTVPVGERYTPTYQLDGTLTKVGGTYLGDAANPQPDTIPANLTNGGNPVPASLFYRNPLAAGSTWRKRIKDGQSFRIIKDGTTASRRFYDPQQTTTPGVKEWFVHEVTEDIGTITDSPFSDRQLAPQTVPVIADLTTSNPAYQTVTEIHADYPVLLVAGPETTFRFTWTDPIPAYDSSHQNNYYSIQAIEPAPDAGHYVKEVTAADMPITVDKIKTWSGINHDTWHCQIVARTGVLRS